MQDISKSRGLIRLKICGQLGSVTRTNRFDFGTMVDLKLILVRFLIITPLTAMPLGMKRKLLPTFDGFQWDYDKDVHTRNLDHQVQHGVKAKYLVAPHVNLPPTDNVTIVTEIHWLMPTVRALTAIFVFTVLVFLLLLLYTAYNRRKASTRKTDRMLQMDIQKEPDGLSF
uniref:uncharacterized protein isoform X2 n=1 Tax=Myxine glutinosa TaxID=7769 RepID=UPI00358E4775